MVPFVLHGGASVFQAGFDVFRGEPREGREQVADVGVVGEVGEHPFDRNARTLHHRLPDHNLRISDDAVVIGTSFGWHDGSFADRHYLMVGRSPETGGYAVEAEGRSPWWETPFVNAVR